MRLYPFRQQGEPANANRLRSSIMNKRNQPRSGTTHPPGRIHASPGFTLVEMILVITIMAIALGTITPNFKPFLESTTLKNAAQSLSTILRYTRSLAVEHSATTQVEFNPDTGEISIAIETDPINMPGIFEPVILPVKYPRKYQTDILIAGIVKQTLSGTQEENIVSFQSDGTTSDTFVYLADSYENTYTVGVVGLTGQVMVWNHAVQSFYEE